MLRFVLSCRATLPRPTLRRRAGSTPALRSGPAGALASAGRRFAVALAAGMATAWLAGAGLAPLAVAGELGADPLALPDAFRDSPDAQRSPDLPADPVAPADPVSPAAPSGPSAPRSAPPSALPSAPSGAAGGSGSAQTAEAAVDPRRFVGSVVQIRTRAVADGQTVATLGARRSGSGVIIGPSTVLTIGYLLLEADQVEVITDSGRRIPASVAGQDPDSGLGLVRTAIPLDGRPIELGDSEKVAVGDRVLTLGHGEPEATELAVLSRKPFSGSWEYLLERPLFTFPPVNNWSGAALFSGDGKLVGIGSLIVNDAAPPGRPAVPGNLFVPVGLLRPVLDELLASGRRAGPARPWLGVSTESVRGNLMVARVTRGGPAEKAGLAPGDIILGVGEASIDDQADFYRQVWKLGPAGAEIPLRVLKDGEIRLLKVPSVEREAFLRKPQGI
ncbi:PDZ domain-containing protein [Burkholderiaceae bacterium FT117]|uniref:S1C family serine protease n=1 Tax=Zeimonas sediminis TaxID=2944268 RepID=UPI0023431D80|nr:trypsin-like peptidase domain-containing protein [Zeimonas sediminis]MCM5571185.1 PDZ domain-containing protein [Zeimonas sediminis]